MRKKSHIRNNVDLYRLAFFAVLLSAIAFFLTKEIQPEIAKYSKHSDNLSLVVASALVNLANENRSATGISELKVNSKLTEAAQAKANDMAQKSYFSHQGPDGKTPWSWIQESQYQYMYAGENLAIDFDESWNVNQAWLESPTHRANLMFPGFTEIGIAVATGTYNGRDTTFVVQMFGTPLN